MEEKPKDLWKDIDIDDKYQVIIIHIIINNHNNIEFLWLK